MFGVRKLLVAAKAAPVAAPIVSRVTLQSSLSSSFFWLAKGFPATFSFSSPSTQLRSFASASASAGAADSIRTIGVIGAGQMGTGIALVAAQTAKLRVVLVDANADKLTESMKFADGLLAKNVAKNKITQQQREETMGRLSSAPSLSGLRDVDFVVEAVSENIGLKQTIFRQLSELTRPDVILASNTSSISITKIAAATTRPDKVIGMHFMNPVPVMKLVEIISGIATSKPTLDITLALAKKMDKVTTNSADVPGFIANRLLMPYINEAVVALQEGVGTIDDIDTTMKLGTNVPMGPLQLADFIGLDTCLSIMRVLHSELGDSKYRPSPLLVKYVDAGWLGKKSGRGFYKYDQ